MNLHRVLPDAAEAHLTEKLTADEWALATPIVVGQKQKTRKASSHAGFSVFDGGEGGIRTPVPGFPDHPISSRRRYDRFGTSPHSLRPH